MMMIIIIIIIIVIIFDNNNNNDDDDDDDDKDKDNDNNNNNNNNDKKLTHPKNILEQTFPSSGNAAEALRVMTWQRNELVKAGIQIRYLDVPLEAKKS